MDENEDLLLLKLQANLLRGFVDDLLKTVDSLKGRDQALIGQPGPIIGPYYSPIPGGAQANQAAVRTAGRVNILAKRIFAITGQDVPEYKTSDEQYEAAIKAADVYMLKRFNKRVGDFGD